MHPNQIQQWKKTLMESASEMFQSKTERKENKPYGKEAEESKLYDGERVGFSRPPARLKLTLQGSLFQEIIL